MKKERVVCLGEAQLLTQMGALPLTFEIKADALGQATEKVAVECALKGLQEMRREAPSRIIIPDRLPPDLGGPGSRCAGAAISIGRRRS
jgi:hypothetical protein